MTAWLRELRSAKELLDIGVIQTTLRHAGTQAGEPDIIPQSSVRERDEQVTLTQLKEEELHARSHLCIEAVANS